MRGNAEMHELVAPGSLGAVLDLLAAEPGQWTPIAGGNGIDGRIFCRALERAQAGQPLGHSRPAHDLKSRRRASPLARPPRF